MEKQKKYQQEISQWEIKLSQRLEEYSKIKRGVDGKYHILYKTVCLVSKKIYIGIHSSKRLKTPYLGCGISANVYNLKSTYTQNNLRRSPLWRAVVKYGAENFHRQNIAYYNNREELVEAEIAIVNKEFVGKKWNYNGCVGGSEPPTNRGKKNGNYGNRWTEEQKKALSDKLKGRVERTRGNNSRAVKCVCVDVTNMEITRHGCGRDLAEYIGATNLTIATWLPSAETMSRALKFRRYAIFREEDYEKELDLKEKLVQIIDNSKVRVELKNKYKQNVRNFKS